MGSQCSALATMPYANQTAATPLTIFTHLLGSDFVVYLLDADLPGADVPAHRAQVLHSGQGQLAQVPVLYARTANQNSSVITVL